MKAITFILSLVVLFGCTQEEKQCENGDVVLLNYKMFIRDSIRINENDHSAHSDLDINAPHKVVLGNDEIYPKWEKDILSRKENESGVVYVPVRDVYHKDAVLDQGNIQHSDTIKIEYTVLEIQKN